MNPAQEKVVVVNVFNTIGKMVNYLVAYSHQKQNEPMTVPSQILLDVIRND